jgi:hypothetical protein
MIDLFGSTRLQWQAEEHQLQINDLLEALRECYFHLKREVEDDPSLGDDMRWHGYLALHLCESLADAYPEMNPTTLLSLGRSVEGNGHEPRKAMRERERLKIKRRVRQASR